MTPSSTACLISSEKICFAEARFFKWEDPLFQDFTLRPLFQSSRVCDWITKTVTGYDL